LRAYKGTHAHFPPRSTADTYDINQTGIPYALSVSGFTSLNNNKVSIGAGNSFSCVDNLTWVKDRHTLKAGVEIYLVALFCALNLRLTLMWHFRQNPVSVSW
jgi:hypothetical protein